MIPARKKRGAQQLIGPSRSHRSQRPLGRRYWWLLSATGTSGLGNGLVAVGFPLLALSIPPHRPLGVAAVAAAGRLPWLLISLPAGALADRVDRRRLVVGIEGLRALVLGAVGLVILAGPTPLSVLLVTAFVIGALETALSAATGASLPTLVHPDDLPRANGYLFTAETTGEQFAGPALGGLIFAVSKSLPFLGDAVSFAGSGVLLAAALPRRHESEPRGKLDLIGDTRAGLRWFRQSALLRRLGLVVAGFAFCQSAVLSIIVIYGKHVLGLSSTRYGLFLAVAALGDVVGNLLAARVHARLGPANAIVAAGLTAAAGYLILAASTKWGGALCGLILEAVGIALGNIATLSLRQRCIPPELFGRVNNAFRTCAYGALPLGALAGGLAAGIVGLQGTFLVAGLAQVALIAGAGRGLRARIARLAPPRPVDHGPRPQTAVP